MLREVPDGCKVRYKHERVVNWAGGRRTDDISPKGGRTIARILDAEGTELALGEAVCRPDEQFNKKIGRMVALGRALKALEERTTATKEVAREIIRG